MSRPGGEPHQVREPGGAGVRQEVEVQPAGDPRRQAGRLHWPLAPGDTPLPFEGQARQLPHFLPTHRTEPGSFRRHSLAAFHIACQQNPLELELCRAPDVSSSRRENNPKP